MIRIEANVFIARPVEDVFAFTDVIENEVIWRTELVGSEKTSDGPVGVGTTGRTIYRMGGRDAESRWVITEYELNRKVTFSSGGVVMAHTGTWRYEAVPGGTKFFFIMESNDHLHGLFGRVKEAFIARVAGRGFQADLNNLKRLLEA